MSHPLHPFPRLRSAPVLVAVVLASCGHSPAAPPNQSADASASQATAVTTVTPERATVRRVTEQPGQVRAFEETPVFAKISGYVRVVHKDIGDAVEQDEVLAEVWIPELEDELRQKESLVTQAKADHAQAEAAIRAARAAVATARAKVAEAEAATKRSDGEYERWKAELARIEKLASEKAIQPKVADETRNQFRAAEAGRDENAARIASAHAGVEESEAKLEKARADADAATARVTVAEADRQRTQTLLGYTRIPAPFAGVVEQRNVDTGHFIPASGTTQPLFVVVRSDPVRIFVHVPEMEAPGVSPGSPARMRIQALGDEDFEGSVTRSSWALDPTTRTLRTEIDVPNPDGKIRPGMYAYATIVLEEHKGVLTLPTSAIVKQADQKYVCCVTAGKIARKPVRTGLEDGARIEIVSGLDGDEAVIPSNAASLKDGQPVQVDPAAR